MSDLINSDKISLNVEQQTREKFKEAFDILQNAFKEAMKQSTLNQNQLVFLRKILSINNINRLYKIFVQWKKLDIPNFTT